MTVVTLVTVVKVVTVARVVTIVAEVTNATTFIFIFYPQTICFTKKHFFLLKNPFHQRTFLWPDIYVGQLKNVAR